MKLTCKICGFDSPEGNLVEHVEADHGGETGLTAYIARYGGVASVIHPSLHAAAGGPAAAPAAPVAATPAPTPRAAMARAAAAPEPLPVVVVEIAGIEMVKRTGLTPRLQALVPKVDPAYHFPEITARVLRNIKSKRPIGFVGHTGTGKTSLIMQIAARLNQPVLRTNLNQQTTISDFVGTWGIKGGETVWLDGALPRSMREDIWLIADEADYGEPAILSVLNPVTEREPALMLKEKDGEVIVPGEHWRIFITGNTLGQFSEWRHLYQGTNLLNEAWLDRFRIFLVGYLPEAAEAEVLKAAVPMMTLNVAKELVKVASLARQAFLKEELASPFSTRRLIDWAEEIIELRSMKAEAPFKAAESTIFSKMSREDAAAVEGFMRRILLGRADAGK